MLRFQIQLCQNKGDTYSDDYREWVAELEFLEKAFRNDWDGSILEDNEQHVELPVYIIEAVRDNDIKRILRWIKSGGNVQDRVNAKSDIGHYSMLFGAVVNRHCDLASLLLQLGADVNAKESEG